MSRNNLNIAFFGSSLVSAYWNGAATYYRGIIKALHQKGHTVTFYEPDAYDRQKHRDIPDPEWAKVHVYHSTFEEMKKALNKAASADVIIKASGIGVFDDEIAQEVVNLKTNNNQIIFWDVDAPATLDGLFQNEQHPFRKLIPEFDYILTYGGGQPVIDAYKSLFAKECIPIYNALDPDTHHEVPPIDKFNCDLAFLGNRLPDREERVEHFFIDVAQKLPTKKFILGGSGWENKAMPGNIKYLGHVYTNEHNAFNCTPRAVLNISRQSMADYGFSPATRVFEAAGAGACIISDEWKGIDSFLEPGEEILIAQNSKDVAQIVKGLNSSLARKIGKAAKRRVLEEHTYTHRVELLEKILQA